MTPAGTSNELDVQNEWEEKKHTHTGGCSEGIDAFRFFFKNNTQQPDPEIYAVAYLVRSTWSAIGTSTKSSNELKTRTTKIKEIKTNNQIP